MKLGKFRKNNAKVVTETFEFGGSNQLTKETITIEKDSKENWLKIPVNDVKIVSLGLSNFAIHGGENKVEVTFDERDKEAVIELLRSMADELDDPLAITGQSLYELFYNVKASVQEVGVWKMNVQTLGFLRKVFPAIVSASGLNAEIFGRPIIVDNSMPDIGKPNAVIFE